MLKNTVKNVFWLWLLLLLTAPIIAPAIEGYKEAQREHQEQTK